MKNFYYVYNRAQDKPLYRHKDKDSAIKEEVCVIDSPEELAND